MSKRIRELSECDVRTLLAEFDRDRTLPHPGTKGASREDLLVRLLQKRLPGRYGIGSGHLISAENQWSRQQDVIIYDRFDSPLVEDLGHEKIVFVESTLVTIEVKSNLVRDELDDIWAKAANVRDLMPARRFLPHQLAHSEPNPPALSAGFAYDSSLKIGQINEALANHAPADGVDMLCVLRDPLDRSGFFLTHQGRRITALPDPAGEPAEECLRRFLFEILLHLQRSDRWTWQPDLSAYLEVFGIDKFQRLQDLESSLLRAGPITPDQIIEMLYLMGEIPGEPKACITDPKSVFMFKRQALEDNTMIAEVWLFPEKNGTRRPISAKVAWEAARRYVHGEATMEDRDLLSVVGAWFNRMKTGQEELVIKPEPQVW